MLFAQSAVTRLKAVWVPERSHHATAVPEQLSDGYYATQPRLDRYTQHYM